MRLTAKKSGKKGDIDVQFNWIFVMIVGGLILLFFFQVVMKQKAISAQKMTVKLMSDLESIATGAKAVKGTAQAIPMPNLDLVFECGDACDCGYGVGNPGAPFGDMIIFSPDHIIGQNLIAWTLDWKMPFSATNLLFFTGTQVRYIIIGDRDDWLRAEMNRSMPNKLFVQEFKDVNELGTLQDTNNYKVKFIFVSGPDTDLHDDITLNLNLGALANMKNPDVKAVYIRRKAAPISVESYDANIAFYEMTDSGRFAPEPGGARPAYGKAMIYAAIFADDGNMYDCGMREAFRRYSYIVRIYHNRTNILSDYFISGDGQSRYECGAISVSSVTLDVMYDLATGLARAYPPTGSPNYFDQLKAYGADLAAENNNLMLKTCPEVY